MTGFPGVSDTNVGWTIGVGVEGAIVGNWTAKVEYLYADLGDTTCSAAACGVATNVDLRVNILRGGRELPLLRNQRALQTLKPRTAGPGLHFLRHGHSAVLRSARAIQPNNPTAR